MKSLFYFLLPILGLFSSICYATEFSQYPITSEETGQITIHNRILTKFNNKIYSVLDVVKKMDMIFDSHYPQFAHSKLARYQFYNAQWKDTLQKMLDQELILLDAERIGVKATNAEVREELLRKYGPNLQTSLARLNLSRKEADKMISEDLIAEKTLYFKVYSEALRVRPNDIKEKYKAYCEKNPASQKWHYQVLTIRSEDENISQALAQLAFDLLKEKRDLSDISKNLQSENPNTTVLFTPEIISDNASISQAHKTVIETLNPGDFSTPISQVNKDRSIVHRIFYLKEKDVINPPEFSKLAEKIKDGLIQESIALHLSNYMKTLKTRYGFSEQDLTINSDFKPFSYQ